MVVHCVFPCGLVERRSSATAPVLAQKFAVQGTFLEESYPNLALSPLLCIDRRLLQGEESWDSCTPSCHKFREGGLTWCDVAFLRQKCPGWFSRGGCPFLSKVPLWTFQRVTTQSIREPV